MIIEGQELQVFDLVACYAQRYQKTLIYFDLITYNALDATCLLYTSDAADE